MPYRCVPMLPKWRELNYLSDIQLPLLADEKDPKAHTRVPSSAYILRKLVSDPLRNCWF